ncbi:MAG: NAD(P)/FAD-dependent oxidoreductase [Rhodobacteraceae bacterium]|jgi:phytoene dehydrogenase-like protein|uniref:phytoene desaturase family protein n=1 Tax=Albidovulum sp. TaxID=1872424 RepID=UPI001DB32CA0|nr:NAD(P)/FAD-dependent oxidoreductase [uncultured Defluviimonas sp.]MCB2126087.1 NAD(P)/FAD-dependent oxidoreductase [Paracoccaceae bacterium]MCC0070460.1 NAD(P)/FAD-dependent oxidoreductase [Paracoccaceae bacterium]
MSPDAIVIGAGHNGLVAAARLGLAGRRVLVLEAQDAPGGLLGEAGGMRVAAMPTGLDPEVARALALHRHGLRPGRPLATIALGGNAPVRIEGGSVRGIDAAAAAAFADLHRRLGRHAAALAPMMAKVPPRLRDGGWGDLMTLARMGLGVRMLGRAQMRELLRVLLSNVWDLLDDEIGDGPLSGALAMEATLGGAMGPRSPGTVLPLLYRFAGRPRTMPEGGAGAIVAALVKAVEATGGQVRTGARVAGVLTGDDRVAGVRLEGGEEIRAPLVVSNAHPRATLLDLLGVRHLDAEDARRARLMATEGMVARLDLTLGAAPGVPGAGAPDLCDRMVIAPDMKMLETAFNAAKYKGIPERPGLECHWDAGASRLAVSAQFVPCGVKGGWSAETRDRLLSNVVSAIDDALPGTAAKVTGVTLATPADIEARFALPGGHWHHGEFRVDQMLMLRPFAGAAQYRMPVAGLYLCGAGAHPGGDVTGLPGWNAAGAALKDGRRA